ncbi:sigma factor [Yinghuangia seranimata]|uniref:sigma factor n=1 Tax=Yinghuangia seranimata TaxID=408067 RepID=UPI00248B7D19|nr:sigma factor [Yinghuangia seranimata]MDI2128222.1 sigma factor [Yinghuangia seranimata]
MGLAEGIADQAVHRRLVHGDEAVLGEVYDAHAAWVYGVALRTAGDPAVAEQVTGEVFLRLWERPYDFDPLCGSLRTWLAVRAHRRAAARTARVRVVGRGTAASGDAEVPSTAEVLATLPVELRDVVELAYFCGLTYRQVAAELSITELDAAQRLRTGLLMLGEGGKPGDATEVRL